MLTFIVFRSFLVMLDILFWLCLFISSMTCMWVIVLFVCVCNCFVSSSEAGSGCVSMDRLDLAVCTMLASHRQRYAHPCLQSPGMQLVVPAQLTLTPPPGMHLCIFSLSSVTCVVNFSLELIIVGYFPWLLVESFILQILGPLSLNILLGQGCKSWCHSI